jgi:diguanylate cyclase (GGDEF)-like protein/PAS domain S-box-containing protein
MPEETRSSVPKPLLHAHQVELLFKQSNVGLLVTLVCGWLLVVLSREQAPATHLLVWVAALTALTLARYLELHLFRTKRTRCSDTTWERVFLTGSALSGFIWGLAAFFIIPHGDAVLQIFTLLMIAGLCAGTVATYTAVPLASPLFVIGALLPTGVRLYLEGGMGYSNLVAVYGALVLMGSGLMHRNTLRFLHASLDNERLTRELAFEIQQRLNATKKHEKKIENILDHMQDIYFRSDNEGRIIMVSSFVEKLLGYNKDELIGKSLADYYYQPDGREKFLEALHQTGTVSNYEVQLKHKDGSAIWASSNAHFVNDAHGNIIGVEGTTRDITELKHAREALIQEKEQAQITLASIGDGVISTDEHGIVRYMNPVAEQATGWPLAEAKGRQLDEVFRAKDEKGEHDVNPIDDILHERREYDRSRYIMMQHRTGFETSIVYSASSIQDDEGSFHGAILVFRDISELRRLERRLTYQATHDPLTGLINRREFEDRLEHAIVDALNSSNEHALLYLDLDQFKVVNDTCGHYAGDELLRQVSDQLSRQIRDTDTLGRLGGDEFGVLLEHCPLEKARSIAEQLRVIVKDYRFHWEKKSFEIGVSIGVVPITATSGNLVDVMSAADAACYVAKDLGRNRLHVYREGDVALSKRKGEMEWVHQITHAIDNNELFLYCQRIAPITRQADGSEFYELMVRMHGQETDIVLPGHFIPAAERYNLMTAIDSWVVHEAFRFIHDINLSRQDTPITFAINLSGQSLCDDKFLRLVINELDSSGVFPGSVCFEVTETAAVSNLTRAISFISILRGMGCRFALDDFGSGLSSFAYLKNLTVDYLKIDGSFIRDIADDPIDHALVSSINQIGHVMGIRTIAEFVESDEILGKLRDIGVDYVQGYNVHKPEPLRNIFHEN